MPGNPSNPLPIPRAKLLELLPETRIAFQLQVFFLLEFTIRMTKNYLMLNGEGEGL